VGGGGGVGRYKREQERARARPPPRESVCVCSRACVCVRVRALGGLSVGREVWGETEGGGGERVRARERDYLCTRHIYNYIRIRGGGEGPAQYH